MISRMIASGSSERGLSLVTIATSASSDGDPAHERALAAVAVAAAAEDAEHARRGAMLARGAQDVLQRVGRVRVVDDDREVLALVDRLEAPRHLADGRAAPRRSTSSSTPSARAAWTAARQLRTLNGPGSGVASSRAVEREARAGAPGLAGP